MINDTQEMKDELIQEKVIRDNKKITTLEDYEKQLYEDDD